LRLEGDETPVKVWQVLELGKIRCQPGRGGRVQQQTLATADCRPANTVPSGIWNSQLIQIAG